MSPIRAIRGCICVPRSAQMLATSLRTFCSLLLASTWVGCAGDEPAMLEPSFQAGSQTIAGRILGPDGRNICRTVEEGTMLVRLLNPEFGITSDVPFLAEQDLTCPDNSFSVSAEEGPAFLRVELPTNPNIDDLPWRNFDRLAVAGDAAHNLRVEMGTPLRGRARLDGRPFEGIDLTVSYEFNGNFGATFGGSGPDGRWTEFFGRSPMILQNGRRYFAFSQFCDAALGTRQLVGPPVNAFLFPVGRSAVNCTLETAAATRFSHTSTRLVVTPMPGDIGGFFGSPLSDQYGVGWGVQFPVPPGSPPAFGDFTNSHVFNGGLLVGIARDRVLAGFDVATMMECGPSCLDLGLDGVVEFTPVGGDPGRKAVIWRYSDAASAERVGLRVIQRSIDGSHGHDYVLFRFLFRNTSSSTLRFWAGFAGDWDIDLDAFDDRGFTALNGSLMYQVSEAESGVHVGTMLLGEVPVSGNYFFSGFDEIPSVATQFRALRGRIVRTRADPGDLRYIQGAGPIRLEPQETQDIWIAVVAGENRAQLLDNAAAARADVARRLSETLAEQATTPFNPGPPIRGSDRTSARPYCKACTPGNGTSATLR
jgi:hypothetical protein